MSIDPAQDARFVAELDADASVGPVAAEYAEGLMSAADAAGVTAQVIDEFESLIRDVLVPNPKFEGMLASALISSEEKEGIIDRVFGSQASELMIHFLKVVARHDRLEILRSIYAKLHELYTKQQGKVDIVVTTATPIDAATAQQIAQGVSALVQGEAVIQQQVDPDMIGGVVVRVGDTVYDASIATQLKNVRQQMIDRSAHEIQSRRDSFSNTAGN